MTTSIVVSNQKGGVGKTMFAVHLAEYCAEKMRVLFVDVDGQGNSTRYFLEDRAEYGKGASLLFGNEEQPAIIEVKPNLSIIPADRALNDVEAFPLDVIEYPKQHLKKLAAGFDVVIFDTPPAQGRRLLGALIAANNVVTPLGLDKASFEGIEDLLTDIKGVRGKLNPRLNHVGILVNRYKPANKEQRANLQSLQEALGAQILPTVLQDRSPVGTAFDHQLPIWKRLTGDSARKASKEFRDACETVYRRSKA